VKPIFGTRGSEVQILSPRPFFSSGSVALLVFCLQPCSRFCRRADPLTSTIRFSRWHRGLQARCCRGSREPSALPSEKRSEAVPKFAELGCSFAIEHFIIFAASLLLSTTTRLDLCRTPLRCPSNLASFNPVMRLTGLLPVAYRRMERWAFLSFLQ